MYRPTYVGGLVFNEDCMRAPSMGLTFFLQVEKLKKSVQSAVHIY